MKIIIRLRKQFPKKNLASLNVLMEVMMTTHLLMLTAEAELGKCASAQVCFKIKLTDLKQKDCPMIGTHPFMFFFKPTPSIEYIKERCVHVFECCAKHCKGKVNGRMVRRYLDTSDAKSTGNLRKHARVCWGQRLWLPLMRLVI